MSAGERPGAPGHAAGPVGAWEELTTRQHAALAVASRRRLLDLLRSAGRPLAVPRLAAAVGLHLTTTRSAVDRWEAERSAAATG